MHPSGSTYHHHHRHGVALIIVILLWTGATSTTAADRFHPCRSDAGVSTTTTITSCRPLVAGGTTTTTTTDRTTLQPIPGSKIIISNTNSPMLLLSSVIWNTDDFGIDGMGQHRHLNSNHNSGNNKYYKTIGIKQNAVCIARNTLGGGCGTMTTTTTMIDRTIANVRGGGATTTSGSGTKLQTLRSVATKLFSFMMGILIAYVAHSDQCGKYLGGFQSKLQWILTGCLSGAVSYSILCVLLSSAPWPKRPVEKKDDKK